MSSEFDNNYKNSEFYVNNENSDYYTNYINRTEIVPVIKKKILKEAGFDLTGISEDKWKALLVLIGASEEGMLVNESTMKYKWIGQDVTIYTQNNPITGEYAYPEQKEPEIGYASYIGIEGNDTQVKFVYDYILENADYIKHYNPNKRSYI